MPLEAGDFGDLNEKPLACSVIEVWFKDAELHCATGVNEDL